MNKILWGILLLLIGVGFVNAVSERETRTEFMYYDQASELYESDVYREIKKLDSLDQVNGKECNCTPE